MLAAQAPCDLGHEVFRQPQVIEGLLERLDSVVRLAAVPREALLGLQAATWSGFGVFFASRLRGGMIRFFAPFLTGRPFPGLPAFLCRSFAVHRACLLS